MDPLSISAAVAGLLTLTVEVIKACDDLHHNVKRRPKLLKDLSDDLSCLASVLEELTRNLSEKPAGEEAALRRCLDGCHNAIKDVRTEITAVKALLDQNIVFKAYTQLTFKSRLGEIMESRNRVDKFTSAVSVALAVRQHVSTQTIHSKLDKLAAEISQTKKGSNQTAKWLDPLQQYVDASSSVIVRSDSRSSSSVALSSGTTVVGDDASVAGQSQTGTSVDTDVIASFGSFDDWLESFTQEEDEDKVQTVADGRSKTSLLTRLTQKESATSPVRRKVELRVKGLPAESRRSSKPEGETLSLALSDLWDDALRLLQEKGYKRVCGFKLGNQLLDPLASHADDVYVTVTEGPSKYSMSGRLYINIHEPLELYFDDFVRVGETGHGVQPLSLFKISDEGKIVIVDYFGTSSKKVEVALSKTLRVPENGTMYHPPALLSPFPLISAEELSTERLPQLRKKGGLLVPLWQREALALTFSGEPPKFRYTNYKPPADFAIKIYAGSVNVLSGATSKRAPDDAQDYVTVPVQNRLDGFLLRAGVVKQFVSMPLGAGYTAEGQITGQELLGGLQMLIAPRFRARGTFKPDNSQRKTPRELRLKVGNHIFMSGKGVTSRAREIRHRDVSTYFTGDSRSFHGSAEARPRFVHEMLVQHLNLTDMNKPLSLEAVLPYRLDIRVRERKEYSPTNYRPGPLTGLRDARCGQAKLPQEYSPFLGMNDLVKSLAQLLAVSEIVLYTERNLELDRPAAYVPIHKTITDGVVLYCQGYTLEHYVGAAGDWESPKPIGPKKELKWDMGLAPGGEIKQSIVPDSEPLDWNWMRARLVNVQILNSVVFESLTGVIPPPPPISFADYLHAKLPFYHLLGNEAIAGGNIIGGLQSVGQRDAERGVQLRATISTNEKTVGCVICEKNLADSVLKPCMHVFCGLCVRDNMSDGDKTRCAACRKLAKEVVNFGAPMEMPLLGGQRSTESTDEQENRTSPQTTLQGDAVMKENEQALGTKKSGNAATTTASAEKLVADVSIQPVSRLQKLALSDEKDANAEIDALLAEGCGHNEPVAYVNGRTAMQTAAAFNNVDLLNRLLAAGISANEAPCAISGRTALQAAAESGELAMVKILLAVGADPNGPVSLSGGCSAIEAAAKGDHLTILALLLQHGASVNWSRTRESALHIAAGKGNEAAAALLLVYGFDPDALAEVAEGKKKGKQRSEWSDGTILVTPSELAAENGHLGVLKLLNRNGAKIIPVSTACEHGYIKVVEWLLEVAEKGFAELPTVEEDDGKDDEEEVGEGEFGGYYTSRYGKGNLYGKSSLFDKKTDDYGYPYRKGFEGTLDSLVETAAKHGQAEVLEKLVERGALLRIPHPVAEGEHESGLTDNGMEIYFDSTLLHEAARGGNAVAVAYLLAKGFALEESRVYKGKTPLMEAAEAGQFAAFKFLVDAGANVDAVDRDGHTVAIAAAKSGSEDILHSIFTRDVDLTTIAAYSQSALSAALEEGHESAAILLLEQLHSQNGKSGYNACLSGALRVAARKLQLFVVRRLLECGTDPNFDSERQNNTALYNLGTRIREEAKEDDCIECAQLLVAKGGTVTGLNDILRNLDYRGKFTLAAFYVDNCMVLDTKKGSDVGWVNLIEGASKNGEGRYATSLIRGYKRTIDKDGRASIPWDWSLLTAFNAAIRSGHLDIVDALLWASTETDAKQYIDDATRWLGPRDHMKQYLGENYKIKTAELVQKKTELIEQ